MSGPLRPTRPQVASVRAGFPDTEIPRHWPPANLLPSQPGALGPEQGAWVRLPGVNFPPAGATPVDITGDADLAPGAANAVLLTYALPPMLRFRMVGIGFGADDETALRFLTWAIFSDNVPIPGYVNMQSAVGSIRQLAEIFVSVGSTAVVTIVASIDVTAILTYRYISRVRGYLYAEKEA